jgi:small-conductance mechanosensitive channel
MKFWVRALLDAALIVWGVVLMLIVWGVPADDLSRLSGKALTGFEIGSVTISITDIVTSLVVFALVLGITRVLQRALSDRVLPETHLAVGVQHSLAAGFGYVGIILAIALTLSTLGIDLSNIALIAGALSVGIGFGLQNVVNNFVSGLILLIERPIQVGDWVVVGTNEGRVKRISVRATEIETFQRASVIVPNAELLSNSVTNWTHKNNLGRVEIAVGVAYGSDTEKVRDILLECAKECDEVLAFPEPFVLFLDFGNSSLNFELRCYVGDVIRRLRVATEIRYMIDRRFREESVEIPFPQHVVHMAPAANTDRPRGPDREPDPKPDPEPS